MSNEGVLANIKKQDNIKTYKYGQLTVEMLRKFMAEYFGNEEYNENNKIFKKQAKEFLKQNQINDKSKRSISN